MIGLLLAILGFLFSMWGLMCILIGLLLFILLPLISTVSRFKGPARFFLRLATFPIKRGAIVISEHNDALWKTMRFSGLGVELITIDDEEKAFEDPDNALHHFLGIPFSFANEEHGVLFDPRHAALGMRKRTLDKRDKGEYLATEEEWDAFGVAKWKPGVFEMPSVHELVDLSAVKALVDGGERSEYAKRVEELYKHSRDPFSSGTPPLKVLYPVIAFAMTFGGIWFMAGQIGMPSGPSGTVSYGVLALLVSTTSLPNVDWRYLIALFLFIAIPVGVVLFLFLTFGLLLTIAILFAMFIGFLFFPILTFIGKGSKIIGGGLSKLYFKLGFFGYRQPVITWTPTKYVVKEYDQLETTEEVTWYTLFGHTIGVTYDPGPESWGPEPVTHSNLEAQQVEADGGGRVKTNLPADVVRSSQIQRDDYGSFIPKRLRDDRYYIRSGIALERFKNSADGMKALKKLLEAKEVHGSADGGLDDGQVMKASIVSGALGAILGIAIFILPVFI